MPTPGERYPQAGRRWGSGAMAVVVTAVVLLRTGAGAAAALPKGTGFPPLAGVRATWEKWQLRFEESLKQEPALVYSVPTRDKVVALTVDDGPDPRFTPAILSVLERERVPATFFVVGQNVAAHPDLVRRAVQDGCEVGNHTYSHPEMAGLTPEALTAEIARDETEIVAATGRHAVYFRPPKGYLDRRSFQVIQDAGYRVILWSVALEHHDLLTPAAMAERVFEKVEPGAIILLHDGRIDRALSVEALPLIIRGLRQRGYRFLTVSQLLEHGVPPARRVVNDAHPYHRWGSLSPR
ncbi:MAG: polysaccharide deacetylase family protein [Betaproteobacteria bacterium]